MNASDQLCYAAQMIELARGEEREDGNPLTAVRYYTTAMEVIASEASKCAATMEGNDARRFFFFQVRSKLEIYYERAELLLQVANGSGLLDKPSFNCAASAFRTNYPPALFAPAVANEKGNSGHGGVSSCGTAGGQSVLGIPLQPQQIVPSTRPAPTQASCDDSKEPPMSFYLKPGDDGAAEPPPATPELDVDELMKNLGAPPEL
ncbi:hypothetical protein, conserved [Leishmania tarentolae]|uniref:Uncharacterized protein n=1 Tax=Leishmania tarentolae TaxID=5689 RepID=A0A640KAF6_LEITA|nr:hypothetical protein, conserved [Leishmania tarentolae]